ncbi:MAG: hypothetical protein JWN34_6304 [Bryobacterales bacterium]|nr:hypothetical protein [Bryobacterales bacterium]
MGDNAQLALRSLVICHAPADETPVRELATFLTTNLSLEVSYDTEMPLTGAVERGLSAPFALAVFSPDSVPAGWKRSDWEGAFLQAPEQFESHLGFALLRDCKFPEILRRERFFDFTENPLEAARLVKQWLMRPTDIPRRIFGYAELRAALVDRPGTLHGFEAGSTFLDDVRLEFEQVCRINAAGRTMAGIIGETGHQLGLTLPDNPTRNRELLTAYLAEHRVLVIFDNLTEPIAFGGLSTVITTQGPSPVPPPPPVNELSQGWRLCDFLAPLQRYAEKIETLERMLQIAETKQDLRAIHSINQELFFMRDDARPLADFVVLPTAATDAGQLSLFD